MDGAPLRSLGTKFGHKAFTEVPGTSPARGLRCAQGPMFKFLFQNDRHAFTSLRNAAPPRQRGGRPWGKDFQQQRKGQGKI